MKRDSKAVPDQTVWAVTANSQLLTANTPSQRFAMAIDLQNLEKKVDKIPEDVKKRSAKEAKSRKKIMPIL